MEEDTSKNVAINSDDDEEPTSKLSEKPIIQLFKRLINNDKQSTVLTNTQIVDILDKEFNINLWAIHELEGEIYLMIIKKYFISWPQWEEFDRVIDCLKTKNDQSELNDMLERNYHNLKDYLKGMLERAQALAKNTVNKLKEDKASEAKDMDNKDRKIDDNVVLEVQSSRNQLNQLFFCRPNPMLNDTIFNSSYTECTQIKVNILSLEAILNWWDVEISIQRGSVHYYDRKTIHQLNHVLVNKNLLSKCNPLKVLSQEIQSSNMSKLEKCNIFDINQYISWIDQVQIDLPHLEPLFNFIRLDLRLLPEKLYQHTSYRRYTNKYPYIRYLYKEVKNPDNNSMKYDLQLEETLSPMCRLYLGPVTPASNNLSVEVVCVPCSLKFYGLNLIDELKAHFDSCHSNEPDWKCTNCNKIFPMAMLAKSWWTHKC